MHFIRNYVYNFIQLYIMNRLALWTIVANVAEIKNAMKVLLLRNIFPGLIHIQGHSLARGRVWS